MAWQVDRFVPRVSPFEDEDDDEDEDEMPFSPFSPQPVIAWQRQERDKLIAGGDF
jgi:hypothetical protein